MRATDDYYPTPRWAVEVLREHLPEVMRIRRPRQILDPGCGEGAIMEVMIEAFSPHGARVHGIEIDPERADLCSAKLRAGKSQAWTVRTKDFLALEGLAGDDFDLVVANPPFNLLREFVQKSLDVAPNATVCVLSRLNWVAGARTRDPERSMMLNRWRPQIGVLEKRPAFSRNKDGRLGTDAAEYAWLIFAGMHPGTWGIWGCPP